MNNKLNSLSEVLFHNAEFSKKGIFIINGRDKVEYLSYLELYNESLLLLKNFQDRGIKKYEEMVFQLKDYRSFLITFWACILGGIIPVPITVGNNDEHRFKLFNIWKILKNSYLICDWDFINDTQKYAQENNLAYELMNIGNKTIHITDLNTDNGKGLIAENSAEDIAFIQFSSGSTGTPKGVVLTHKNLMTNIEAMIECAGLCEDDSTFSWMPLTHDMGIIGFHMTPLVRNMNQYIMPTNTFIRNPLLWLEKVSEYRATMLSSPNFGYKYYLQHLKGNSLNVDLSCVKKIFNGAEPISVDVIEEFMKITRPYGLKESAMYPVYGMAEASLAVAFPTVDETYGFVMVNRKFLGVGQQVISVNETSDKDCVIFVDEGYPVSNCSVRLVDNEDNVLPENTIGNIQIKGDNVTKGYYNNEEATNRLINEDGWLKTGDLGFVRNRRIIVTGRAKDIIFINGANYYPHDLERLALEATGIELGKIVACGSYNEELQKEEVLIFVLHKKDIANFLPVIKKIKTYLYFSLGVVVDYIIPVRNIPKTTSGKVQRYKLVQEYKEGSFGNIIEEVNKEIQENEKSRKIDEPGNEVEERLVSICKEVFNTENIGINDNFYDWGGNSLILTTIHQKIEEIYPGKITTSDLFAYPTISMLADYVLKSTAIELNAIRLNESFFDNTGNSYENSLKITVNGNVQKRIEDVAERENMDLYQILAAMFMFSLSRISKDSVINLQCAHTQKQQIIQIDVNFSSVKDFSGLFESVKSHFTPEFKAVRYSIKDLDIVKMNKEEQSVLPFVYYENRFSVDEISMVYDIILQIQKAENELHIFCSYNSKKLSKSAMVNLINYYSNTLEKLAMNY